MVYIAADELLASFAVESLKQLQRGANKDNGLVVAAQFDSDGERHVRRYIFTGADSPDRPLEEDVVKLLPQPAEMASPGALTAFINSVHEEPRCQAENYCLVLWGHGDELLLDQDPAPKRNGAQAEPTKAFLRPMDVKKALYDAREHWKTLCDKHNTENPEAPPKSAKPIDIVAMDACSMSSAEVACELEKEAVYMVASQEEVPDPSFPYDRLLRLVAEMKNKEAAEICKTAVRGYKAAYQDYAFYEPETGLRSLTLSALELKHSSKITTPLRNLASALLSSLSDTSVRTAVLKSRKEAKGFVGGVYVDIFDFCDKLRQEFAAASKLKDACDKVCSAIEARGPDAFVLENQVSTEPKRCHGLSIYFPYLTKQERKHLETPLLKRGLGILTKGGTDILGKGGTDILGKGGTDILGKERRERIEDIESYYRKLALSVNTGWDEFIAHGWSRILAEQAEQMQHRMQQRKQTRVHGSQPDDVTELEQRQEAEAELDSCYSASQCALNLLSLCQKPKTNRKKVANKSTASKKAASKKAAANKAAAA